MEKGLSIRDEALQVSDLWMIHCRIINFSDDAIPQGEPNSARSCIRRAHSVFVTVSPSWLDARSSESAIFVRGFCPEDDRPLARFEDDGL